MSINVSENGKLNQYNALFSMLNQNLLETQQRLATGKKGATYGQLGSGGSQLSISYRSQQSDTNIYSDLVDQLKARTSFMNQITSDTSTSVTKLTATLKSFSRSSSQNNFADNLSNIQSSARQMLQEITARLNSSQAGRYVFSGDLVTTAPIADPNAATNSLVNTASATPPGIDLNSYTNATAAATNTAIAGLTEAQLGYATTLAAAGSVNTRLDNNYNVSYNAKADDVSFKETIRSLATIANLNFKSSDEAGFWTIFNNAATNLETGGAKLNTLNSSLGSTQQIISTIGDQHKSTLNQLELNISGVEDSDYTKDVTILNAQQTQLQAAYQVTAKLSGLSILDYLS